MVRLFLATLLIWGHLAPVDAAPATAVSRYGKPGLEEGFKSFTHANADAPKGGRLKLSSVGSFDSLNSMGIKGIPAEGLLVLFDPLMKRHPGEPFTVYALVAEKADVAEDASRMTIYLNPKARFHDGSPITAEDVKFTIQLLKEKGLPRYRHWYGQIKEVNVKNATTIELVFVKGENGYDAELPLIMLALRPLSKKAMADIDFANSGMTKLLGSGPYKVADADAGRFVTLERVKDYWAADLPVNKGCYNFDTIQVDYYKNTAAQFQAFLAGESDVYFETDPNHWHSAYKSAVAVKSGKIKLNKMPHTRPVALKTIIFNMRNDKFADIRVRKALLLAFDFETLNRMVFFGEMKRPESLYANTPLAHSGPAKGLEKEILQELKVDDAIINTPYVAPKTNGHGDQRENLKKARELLEEAGYKIIKHRCMKDGQQLCFDFYLKDPKLEKIAGAFGKSLSNLGIKLNVHMVDTVQYERRTSSRQFDMIIHTWANSLSPGGEQVYYFSAKTADQEGSSNYIGSKDPVVETLAQRLANCKTYDALTDTVHALDRLVMNQHWMIPLNYDPNLYFAIWEQRVTQPAIDPKVGMNIIELGWSKTAATPCETKKSSKD